MRLHFSVFHLRNKIINWIKCDLLGLLLVFFFLYCFYLLKVEVFCGKNRTIIPLGREYSNIAQRKLNTLKAVVQASNADWQSYWVLWVTCLLYVNARTTCSGRIHFFVFGAIQDRFSPTLSNTNCQHVAYAELQILNAFVFTL